MMYRDRRNEESYKKYSRQKFAKSIDTKLETTMIGALSAFEEEFGELWGHGQDDESLNKKQAEMRKKWIDARCKILNKGNAQKRKINAEMENYAIRYSGYSLNMLVQEI